MREGGNTQTIACNNFFSFQASIAYSIEVPLVLRFIYSFMLVSIVSLFALIVYLIPVRFSFIYTSVAIYFFILSFICAFNLSINLYKIYLLIYIGTCFFVMIV